MKEMTYEDWTKNPTPRMMWVWDNDENRKSKEKVVYISEVYEQENVLSVFQNNDQMLSMWHEHCAEIEEETKRPCTREELIEVLKKQGVPMLKWYNDSIYLVDELFHDMCRVNDVEYTYLELCADFTLLNGTPLWVEE